MIHIGKTARRLREDLGITQRALADQLGISVVHLCNVENDKSLPSAALLERFRKLWGVDLYVLAWCEHGDAKSLPREVREAAESLGRIWKQELQVGVCRKRK